MNLPFMLFLTINSYHPLITDDTATIGKDVFQYEFASEYGQDKDGDTVLTQLSFVNTLSFGLTDYVDFFISASYIYLKEERSKNSDIYGISDSEIFFKYRIHRFRLIGIGLKPVLVIPTGDESKGLGSGEFGGKLFLLLDIYLSDSFNLYVNPGYIRNQNKIDEEENLWHFSVGCDYKISNGFLIVANSGVERNPEKDSKDVPIFMLGGFLYSLNDDLDLSGGFKMGLTDVEMDYNILLGITLRF